jgi:hypothetical protein
MRKTKYIFSDNVRVISPCIDTYIRCYVFSSTCYLSRKDPQVSASKNVQTCVRKAKVDVLFTTYRSFAQEGLE